MPGSAKYRAAGLCTACGKERAPNRTKCMACLAKRASEMLLYAAKRTAEGKCRQCGKPNDAAPKVFCLACTEKRLKKRRSNRLELFNAYGGKCACCGESTFEFLSIDHVNNDGAKHRRELLKTHVVFRHTKKKIKVKAINSTALCRIIKEQGYPPEFQVLCMNCNFAKGKFGICPHERARQETARQVK